LIYAADFVGKTPAPGQSLIWNDATKKFDLTDNLATRAYVNLQVENLAIGLSHSVAVQSISNDPPANPPGTVGKYYIVGTAPTGDWVGHANKVAFYGQTTQGSYDWHFDAPTQGEAHLVEDQSAIFSWSSTTSQWVKTANASTTNLGIENLNNVTHNPKLNGDILVYSTLANRWLGAQPSTIADTLIKKSVTYQVGDIKQSILTEPQFKTMLGAEADDWCLADGRDVTGSTYATLTGQNTIPDLRGAFLRMAGSNNVKPGWNGGTLGGFNEYKTARPAGSPFIGNTSSDGNHTHSLRRYLPNSWSDGWEKLMNYVAGGFRTINGGNTTYNESASPCGESGNHAHTVAITGGGDSETAPRSYSVNWFIKIK